LPTHLERQGAGVFCHQEVEEVGEVRDAGVHHQPPRKVGVPLQAGGRDGDGGGLGTVRG